MDTNDNILNSLKRDLDRIKEMKEAIRGKSPYDTSGTKISYGITDRRTEQNTEKDREQEMMAKQLREIELRINREKEECEKKEFRFNLKCLDWGKGTLEREKELDNLKMQIIHKENLLEQEKDRLEKHFQFEVSRVKDGLSKEKEKEINDIRSELMRQNKAMEDSWCRKIDEAEKMKLKIEEERRKLDMQELNYKRKNERLKEYENEQNKRIACCEAELQKRQEELNIARKWADDRKIQLEEDYLKLNKSIEFREKVLDNGVKKYKEEKNILLDEAQEKNRVIEECNEKINITKEAFEEQEDKIRELKSSVVSMGIKLKQVEEMLSNKDEKIMKMEALLKENDEKLRKARETQRSREKETSQNEKKQEQKEGEPDNAVSLYESREGNSLDLWQENTRREDYMIETEDLILGIGHQLRNPLSIIQSDAQYCLNNYKLKEQVEQNIEAVLKNARLAGNKLEELLKLIHPIQLTLAAVPFSKCLEKACLMVEEKCKSLDIEIEKAFPQLLPQVKYDKKRMEEVLLKVLFNSIEAMPDGGKLSVKSSMGEEENEITVKVIDTGSGIAVHNMENVFKPFFTTKQGAIGLGLYMAKRIVKLHNGKIKIKSEKNRGTEVSITLPVCRQ